MMITLMFALAGASFAVSQAQAAAPAPDIDGHWAELQIEYMMSKDIVGGYPDGTFKPGNTITRAEFMKMVNNASGFTAAGSKTFTDVSAADWYAPEIAKAAAAGFISGYPDGSMRPNANISRQEAAVMIARASQLDLTAAPDLDKFSDAPELADWSRSAVAACSQAGYINGYPDGTFRGSQSITRAEAIVIIKNTMPAVTVYETAGTYGPESGTNTISGDVIIAAAGVNLQNTIITGNLLIAASVGEGSVSLTNLTVQGQTQIDGGGLNAIKNTNTSFGKLVQYLSGTRLANSGGTSGETSGGTSGGGGGGTTTPTVAATAIAITVGGADVVGTVNGNTATVDLSGKADGAMVSAVKITAPQGSTLTITKVNAVTLNTVLSNLSNVSIGQILAGSTNMEVSLSTLRSALGSTMTLTGTLACPGYESSIVTLTINLGGSPTTVPNPWADITSSGTTINAVIKPGMGDTLLKDIGVRDFLTAQVGQIPAAVYVPAISAGFLTIDQTVQIQIDIARLAGTGNWNTATLKGLKNKSIQFTTSGGTTVYTINFSYPNP